MSNLELYESNFVTSDMCTFKISAAMDFFGREGKEEALYAIPKEGMGQGVIRYSKEI